MSSSTYLRRITKQSITAGKEERRGRFVRSECVCFSVSSLNVLTLEFVIHAIQLKNQRPFSIPDCYHFRVKVVFFPRFRADWCTRVVFLLQITFDNNPRAGKIRQHLNSDGQFRTCNRRIIDQDKGWTFVRRDLLITFDFIIIAITIVSFILCLRSLWHGHQLCLEVRRYYASHRTGEKPLSWTDIKVFYSYWYILMIITDLMVLPGSVIKITILFKVGSSGWHWHVPGHSLGHRSIRHRCFTLGTE